MSLFDFHIEHPWILLILLAILPLYLFISINSRNRSVIPYPPIQYKKGSIFPKLIFTIYTVLVSFLLIFLFLTLAKPYRATETVAIEEKGVDVVMVVDVSASMQANDFTPNRLEATKKIIQDFVRRSGGHRMGIIVFGKHVFTLSPLTTDHIVLQELVEGLSLGTINHYTSGGTAIGDALLRGTDILRNIKIPDRDQVIILLTDGDNNAGIDPILATKFAVDNDVRIYTIGLGSTQEITVNPDKSNPEWTFKTKLVEKPLKDIANTANGMYFHASNNSTLTEIFQEIAKLEQSPLEIDRIHQKKYFRYPLNVTVSSLFIISLLIQVLFLRRPLR